MQSPKRRTAHAEKLGGISVNPLIILAMAKNTGNNHRIGAVKDRTQTYNPKTDCYVKRDTQTGRFIDMKTSDNTPFKGVTKEK